MYRLQSIALLGGLVLLFAFVGYGLSGWGGALLILGAAVVVNAVALDRARDMVLWVHRARTLDPTQAPGLHSALRELTGRAGIETPQLGLYPSQIPNAFAVSGRRHSVVAAG